MGCGRSGLCGVGNPRARGTSVTGPGLRGREEVGCGDSGLCDVGFPRARGTREEDMGCDGSGLRDVGNPRAQGTSTLAQVFPEF